VGALVTGVVRKTETECWRSAECAALVPFLAKRGPVTSLQTCSQTYVAAPCEALEKPRCGDLVTSKAHFPINP